MVKFKKLSSEFIFIENSSYKGPLRLRILKDKLLVYKCSKCDLSDIWNGKFLTLQIDHINGISNDNRINNLRFLCPNCHSQTHTFAGKNRKKAKNINNQEIKNTNPYNPKISFRQKKNPIWDIPLFDLCQITSDKNTFSDILKYFGYPLKGAQYKSLKERLFYEKIDFSHIKQGSSHNKGSKYPKPSKPLKEVIVENSSYPRYLLKKRLLEQKVLKEQCVCCGQQPLWLNNILILQIDHINGIYDDNRLENLRLLCPNCHSQTETYAGKNNIIR